MWKRQRSKFGLLDPMRFLQWVKMPREEPKSVKVGDCFWCHEQVFALEGEKYKVMNLRHPLSNQVRGPFPVHAECKTKNMGVAIPVASAEL